MDAPSKEGKRSRSSVTQDLSRWYGDLNISDNFIIIWTITINNILWCLPDGVVDEMEIYIIDPYSPYNSQNVDINYPHCIIELYRAVWSTNLKRYGMKKVW